MTARTDRHGPEHRPEVEPEAALSGWDPYIIAITGSAEPRQRTPWPEAAAPLDPASGDTPPTISRKLALMAWLRAHGAATT